MFFYFISSADLFSIPFYCILFYFISNRFDSIESDLLSCSVFQFLISFSFLLFCLNSFVMNVFLTHTYTDTNTHARTRTHTYIWMYVSSYASYILLRKDVSEALYSSNCIISYLIWLDKIITIMLSLWYYLYAITIHWIMIVIVIVVVIVIICNESLYILFRLVLFFSSLESSWLDLTWVALV